MFTKIIGFGDSITEAAQVGRQAQWLHLLERGLNAGREDRPVTVLNAGVGGNTSREGLRRFDRDVRPGLPALVLVEFGGNDATNNLARHVSLAEFESHLETMAKKVRAGGGACCFLTFPPVVDDWHAIGHDAFYEECGGLDACVEGYRGRTREIAGRLGAPLFDLDRVLRRHMAADGAGIYILPDGVHLTEQGNRVFAEELLAFLRGAGAR